MSTSGNLAHFGALYKGFHAYDAVCGTKLFYLFLEFEDGDNLLVLAHHVLVLYSGALPLVSSQLAICSPSVIAQNFLLLPSESHLFVEDSRSADASFS